VRRIANERAPLSLRVRVRLHTGSLDRELATGSRPLRDDCVLRARQLGDLTRRRQLARSMRRLVAEAGRPAPNALSSTVPVDRTAIDRCREGLLGIAERLERSGPANPCGVARVAVLLADGASPLYFPAAERSLDDALWWIADGLQPCPPHEWDCPVIMKLDPEHVAWTCRRCGAIALTDDLSVRPA
jgi:hypothetical protein